MKITVLVENTSCFREYRKEMGLSLFIKTTGHNILFDSGLGNGFIRNAEKMGVDLRQVDLAFISHGHDDHGRRINEFLQINPSAPVYVQKSAFGPIYAEDKGRILYAGLDRRLVDNPRFVKLDGTTAIGGELQIIAGIPPKKEIKDLLVKKNGEYLPDTFEHEQSLVISENGKNVLVTGCSHCGIDRILQAAKNACGRIDAVVGGFHLIAYDFDNPQDLAEIDDLARKLASEQTMYYTCHCTGTAGYTRLKRIMGEKVGYLSTGNTIVI